MVERKILVGIVIIVLIAFPVWTSSLITETYALGNIPPPFFNFEFDLISSKGFLNVTGDGTPEFILHRGTAGEFQLMFTSVPFQNRTVKSIIDYPKTSEGVIYNIEPSTLIITPNSSVTVTITIVSTIDSELKKYREFFTINSVDIDDLQYTESFSVDIYFTIIDTFSTSLHTNSSTVTKEITITTTTTSTTETTPMITTTLTTITEIDYPTDNSFQAWIISTAIITMLLAAILILRKRR